MQIWWDSLNLMQQVFACVAIPATLILILQTILLLFGVGADGASDGDVDIDADASDIDMDFDTDTDFGDDLCDCPADIDAQSDGLTEVNPEHEAGLRLLTVRGLVAFLSIGGWFGVALPNWGANEAVTVIVALVTGLLALFLVAWFLHFATNLQDSGNIELKNAIGLTAQVYIPIPANMAGTGKISLTVQERFMEFDAMTQEKSDLKSGSLVKVTSLMNDGTFLVNVLQPAVIDI